MAGVAAAVPTDLEDPAPVAVDRRRPATVGDGSVAAPTRNRRPAARPRLAGASAALVALLRPFRRRRRILEGRPLRRRLGVRRLGPTAAERRSVRVVCVDAGPWPGRLDGGLPARRVPLEPGGLPWIYGRL